MTYSETEVLKALDVAIDSNNKAALLWVSQHHITTSEQLLRILKNCTNISSEIKQNIIFHKNFNENVCQGLRKTKHKTLLFLILISKKLSVEYRKTWLCDLIKDECFREFKIQSKIRYCFYLFGGKYTVQELADALKDVWPEFYNIVMIKNIIQ